jgi:hypothetical protein
MMFMIYDFIFFLPTADCLLPTAYCLLATANCLLFSSYALCLMPHAFNNLNKKNLLLKKQEISQ